MFSFETLTFANVVNKGCRIIHEINVKALKPIKALVKGVGEVDYLHDSSDL